jgi:WhiB family redox-sensing transcriptional regulator
METNVDNSVSLKDYPFDGSQLCNDNNSELFFPDEYTDAARVNEARSICRACSLQTTCLEYALKSPWLDGVWGGTTPRQRTRMRGNRKKLQRLGKP